MSTLLLASAHSASWQQREEELADAKRKVTDLYTEVIARRPIGIPWGEDMKVFSPYLSKALHGRLKLGLSCGKDWYRQYPRRDLKPLFAWLELDIFSGDSEKAAPREFDIDSVTPMGKGVTRVVLRLRTGEPGYPVETWLVAATMVLENGRPVLDDVIYQPDIYGNDDRLSRALSAGCRGGRWVGRSR
ncbi:hypothetical protein [Roseateles sp. P5_E7]